MAHRSSFALLRGSAGVRPTCARHCYCLPASLAARRWDDRRRGNEQQNQCAHLVHLLSFSLGFRVRFRLVCCSGLPASLATVRGRKRSDEGDDEDDQGFHFLPRLFGFAFRLLSVAPTLGRKSSRRAICNPRVGKTPRSLSDRRIRTMRIARGDPVETMEIDNETLRFVDRFVTSCG